MKNSKRRIILLLSLFAMFFAASGSYYDGNPATIVPDYTGKWDFTFYNTAGKPQGNKTLEISDDGSFSDKMIMSIDNVVYQTELSGNISANGSIREGKLTDTDKLEMEGNFTGKFTETEGSGNWKNYYNTDGTWKAVRSTKKDKR